LQKKKGTKQRANKEEEEEAKLRVSSFWYYRQHIPNEEQPATAGPDYIEPAPLICFFPPISFFFFLFVLLRSFSFLYSCIYFSLYTYFYILL
jgi:hypothetical protein